MHSPVNHKGNKKLPTEQDKKNVHQFLDYMAIYPNLVVRFHASDIILHADTNASYLTEPEARSCAADLNVPIHVNCNVLKFVAASAAEAETGGFFVTGKYFIIIQNTLE